MKKLLMLGGSHAEIPMIQSAKEMGYYVITTGNQIDGIGHSYADKFICCDFSDKEAICALAEKEQVDAICSGCNDFAALSAAYACEKLGLGGHDSYETALQIHHKDKYRKLAQRLGIASPEMCRCQSDAEALEACNKMSFPVIVKPVDLTGGKGMKRCETEEQVISSVRNAMQVTREKFVIVEEFISGTNHGFSAYLQDGKVSFHFVDNEQYYHNPYLVSGASAPGDVSRDVCRQLCNACEKIAEELSLVDGILHIQFIIREDGEPVIIEVTRRAPGDLYIELVKKAAGIDYPKAILCAELGIKIPVLQQETKNGFWVRHCVMADKTGRIDKVVFKEEIRPYIETKYMWYAPGDEIEDVMKYKAGIVFLHFKDEKSYRSCLDRLTEYIYIQN